MDLRRRGGGRGHGGDQGGLVGGAGSTAHELMCQCNICLGALRPRVVQDYRHAVTGGLPKADVAGDHGAIDTVPEELADVGTHLLAKVRAVVVHREEDALDLERGVEGLANAVDRGGELGNALEGEVLAIERDENSVGGHQGVQGQETERGWRIDEDVVVVAAERFQESGESAFAAGHANQFDLRAGEITVCRYQGQVIDARGRHKPPRICLFVVGKRLIGRTGLATLAFLTHAAGQIGLGIEVHEKDAMVGKRQGCPEIDGSGGLCHATFLVGDSDDSGGAWHVADQGSRT
jgi:hypothetical protein